MTSKDDWFVQSIRIPHESLVITSNYHYYTHTYYIITEAIISAKTTNATSFLRYYREYNYTYLRSKYWYTDVMPRLQ